VSGTSTDQRRPPLAGCGADLLRPMVAAASPVVLGLLLGEDWHSNSYLGALAGL
jgi:hypothetical protein